MIDRKMVLNVELTIEEIDALMDCIAVASNEGLWRNENYWDDPLYIKLGEVMKRVAK